MRASSGTLIVFEGIEGAGKSTQLVRLGARLAAAGIAYETFREPGGTPLGDDIRRLLLDPKSEIAPRAEALLFMASRAELVERKLKPAIAAGRVILLDRFTLSTYAYQVFGRGLDEREVRAANVTATAGLVPDLTLLLRVLPETGAERARQRSAPDRMESQGTAFHARVADAFARFEDRTWQTAHPECGPILPIEADGSADEVESRVLSALTEALPALRSALAA
ncbi:MAG TPA: dTMP kinase [Gemmatimonadaceae bacterium]|nr:dTMP kinase [Gemmatimonadaceae bacterium]